MIPLIKRNFGRVITETPYNQGWVDAVKYVIPGQYRKYESAFIWSFDPRLYSCVKTITEHYFGRVIDSTGGMAEPQVTSWLEAWGVYKDRDTTNKEQHRRRNYSNDTVTKKASSSAFRTLFVLDSAPKEVIKAAYRALSKLHHPDTGGDHETMARINAAYQELEKLGRA